MRASQLKEVIKALYKLKRPLAIEGPPGGGKTSIVQASALELVGPDGYIEKHLPTMLVEDLGIPNVLTPEPVFDYKMPAWYPAWNREDIPDDGILCFDDRNQASPDLQKVIANICQERTLHNVPIKPGWMIIATGNRQKDRAGANRVLTHLRNRETVIELETTYDDWAAWAMVNNIRIEVIAYLKFRSQFFHNFDPNANQNPTPRSWAEGVSPIIGAVPILAEFECIEGAVGEAAATDFVGFLQIYRDLPDLTEIIANPMDAEVPDKALTKYALVGALADHATHMTIENIMIYMGRFNEKEYANLCMSIAQRRDPLILTSPAYVKWIDNNHEIIW